MSETRTLSWSLDAEPHEWMAVPSPSADTAQWREDAAGLFDLLLEADAQTDGSPLPDGAAADTGLPGAGHLDSGHRDTGHLDTEAALDTLLEFSAALGDDLLLVAGLGLPGDWPLPVIVEVTVTGDDPGDLLDAAGARGGLPVSAPTVDDVAEGDGIRVTRLDLDDDGALWAQVSCARRGDGADVVLIWRTSRLELVPRFSPLLEELLGHVTIGTDA